MCSIIDKISNKLKNIATAERKKTNEWFFKTGKGEYAEHDKFIGVSMPNIRAIAKTFYQDILYQELPKLTNSPIHEIRHCGFIILTYKYKDSKKEAFDYYIANIKSANNWDLIDTTTPHVVGDYIYNNKDHKDLLFRLARSSNLWEKRIAILATFAFIKHDEFQLTLDINKILLTDKHDLIHKAMGWMLREIFKKDEKVTTLFLRQNYKKLPRTTLRYAIERMPTIQRNTYLKGQFNVSN